MLFMITQVHTPEACPFGEGGLDILFNKNAKGITLKGRWGGLGPPHHLVPRGGRRRRGHPGLLGARV